MEVNLSENTELKLSRIAAARGRNREELVLEAIDRLVDYDAWFLGEVERGLAQIECGEAIAHDEAGLRLEAYLSSKEPHC